VIVDAIVGWMFGFLGFILALLPGFSEPGAEMWSDTCSIEWAGGPFTSLHGLGCQLEIVRRAGVIDSWLDLTLFMELVILAVSIAAAVTAAKVALWLYERLPFKST
jgi:hypothetical protein